LVIAVECGGGLQITNLPNYEITKSSPHLRVSALNDKSSILSYYTSMLRRYGPQNWWPAQSRFEVIVGAYLTQNTNWGNVERAMGNLSRARVLSVKGIRELPLGRLQKLVRPSGYFRQKAVKLKTFIRFLDKNYSGSLYRMFGQPTEKLRAELLALNGVGPETADSILLYAGSHPVFVVDAYTRRIFERHGLVTAKTNYEEIRALIEQALSGASPDSLKADQNGSDPRHPVSRMSRMSRSELAQHYNELHALIVRVGNQYCRKTAKCEECPLREFLPPLKDQHPLKQHT
jgi:endonuclease-3 related protein